MAGVDLEITSISKLSNDPPVASVLLHQCSPSSESPHTKFTYSPNMARTCCPQYTIRLESLEYKPNKKHRQVINRFNRYILTGEKPGEGEASAGSGGGGGKGKSKAKPKETGDWIDILRSHQMGHITGESKHKFEVSHSIFID